MTSLPEMTNTNLQYDQIITSCKDIFVQKTKDYGTAWRVLRTISIVDQIFIKAQRIRTIQEKKQQRVADNMSAEFKGIINYAVIGLIQLELPNDTADDLDLAEVSWLYDHHVNISKTLMENKNHDYGEAWRDMRVSSLTDLILQKLLRVKSMENNKGKTTVSEGVDANYRDMVNYAVFALIHLDLNSK